MAGKREGPSPPAPIFIVADDERDAASRLIAMLYPADCFFIPVSDPRQVVRYARSFAISATFLAHPVGFPRGGTGRLLQDLLDQVGKPVIVLAEDWSPESAERWKRMGAHACVPHPTRTRHRLKVLNAVIREFMVAHYSGMTVASPPRTAPGAKEKRS